MRRLVPLAIVLFIWSMATHGKYSDSGDEPHYLLTAESLLSDHDLDLTNNLAKDDARWFGADGLQEGPHARPNRFGRLWTVHDIGVSIAVLPVYAVATRVSRFVPADWLASVHQTQGLFAYSIVSLALTIAVAWAIALALGAAARRTSTVRAATLALVLGFTPPIVSHAFLVFPETLALVAVFAVLWLTLIDDADVTGGRMIAVAIVVGLLPWLHRKYSLFELGLMFAIWHERRAWFARASAARRAVVVAAAILPQLLLHAWTLYYWGNLGGPQMLDALPFSIASWPRGALGLIFDRERGLLSLAPIFLILPACWAVAWRRARVWLVPILLLFVPMAAYADWTAGFAPAARYLVPIVPLLALPALWAMDDPWLRRLAFALVVFQAAVAAVIWQHPRWLWPRGDARNLAMNAIPGLGPLYAGALPSLATGEPLARTWFGLAAVVVLAALGVVRRSARRAAREIA
ncbi:MAG TPA: hypothetical protein VGJ29_07530 [Vicinamibacterales bacterium]|jgi:hypothetical protein